MSGTGRSFFGSNGEIQTGSHPPITRAMAASSSSTNASLRRRPRITSVFAVFFLIATYLSPAAHAQTTSGAWEQVGSDINGAASSLRTGDALAMSADGTRIAIGGPGFLNSGSHAGEVRVFQRVNDEWIQVGDLFYGDADGDSFGESVALSENGNRVVIGAIGNDNAGQDAGLARVFEWTGINWVQVGSDLTGEAVGDLFGTSVAISNSGSRIAVSAQTNDGNGSRSGHVRVFDFVNGGWQQVGADIDGESAGDLSGENISLSASGTRIAIGATENNAGGLSNSGHVRVFELVNDNWVRVGADIDGTESFQRLGQAVALSPDGNRVVAGSGVSGVTRVFDWTGIAWIQQGGDIEPEEDGDGAFAVDISGDGSRIIVGTPNNDGTATSAGHVRVFDFVGGIWSQVGADLDGDVGFDGFGRTAVISDDGNLIAAGAPTNDASATTAGLVRAFEASASSCNGRNITVDIGAGDVPTAGDDVILGTPGDDVIVASTGDDTICGEGGDDIINAGPGNDWVGAGDGADTVFGLDGNDTLFGGAGNDQIVAGNNNDTVFGGTGTDTLNGGPGNDTLNGGADRDFLFGQTGNDAINGNGGDDLILGVDGIDTINAGSGDDVVNAGPGNDTVNGNDGDDTILGLGGDDILNGNDANDQIFGFSGDDIINGGQGDDQLLGNEGNDTINGNNGLDVLNGGFGDDILDGGAGNDQLFGDADINQNGDDTLTGGAGQDLLVGFAGDDTLNAQDGEQDTVNGGPDTDTCTVDTGAVTDTVFNCEP